MRCTICKKTSDETKIFEGIYNSEMVRVCKECADDEGIPIIKKPSESQLDKADARYTVRERMERISGFRDTTEISDDQIVTQGNLARLRIPPKKEMHEDVLDNYYWELNIARRRKKMSIVYLAEKMQVEPKVIQGIEKGKIPKNFQELFIKLEAFLGIKLLKNHKPQVNFTRSHDEEQEILKAVRRKMSSVSVSEPEDEIALEISLSKKKEQLEKLSKGKIDFSRRQALQDVTLNDLVEMKRKKEKRKIEIREESLIGDDIEIDLDEL
ncbi:MAG: hypothetical protein KJ592_00280 [Nanoarchaeota archaeon]|nr:hypothetical protein [Nanoarchaeota archaeon]